MREDFFRIILGGFAGFFVAFTLVLISDAEAGKAALMAILASVLGTALVAWSHYQPLEEMRR